MLGVTAVVAGARAGAAVARNVGRRVTSLVAVVRLFASLVVVVGTLVEEMNVAGTSRTCVAFKCARVRVFALEPFGHVDHLGERTNVRRAIADEFARQLWHATANEERLEKVALEGSAEVAVLRHLA